MRGLWGETQAGGPGSPGDRAREGPGWRVTEMMGSRVSGSGVPGGPQLVLRAVGVLSGGAVPEALPRGPRRLGEAGHGPGSRPPRVPGRQAVFSRPASALSSDCGRAALRGLEAV